MKSKNGKEKRKSRERRNLEEWKEREATLKAENFWKKLREIIIQNRKLKIQKKKKKSFPFILLKPEGKLSKIAAQTHSFQAPPTWFFFLLLFFSENATRHCFENGTWSSSNYSLCLTIEGTISESMFDENITGLTSILYYIGYSVSVVALLVAMFIFLYFK